MESTFEIFKIDFLFALNCITYRKIRKRLC